MQLTFDEKSVGRQSVFRFKNPNFPRAKPRPQIVGKESMAYVANIRLPDTPIKDMQVCVRSIFHSHLRGLRPTVFCSPSQSGPRCIADGVLLVPEPGLAVDPAP